MPVWWWEEKQVVNVLHFISVDFRLSVKCPQVIRERKKKIEKELPFGSQTKLRILLWRN